MTAESDRIIGLVGFRCSGKSYIRELLLAQGYSVFDTNSVKTGDKDAKLIDLDEILRRYGEKRSYFLFVKDALAVHLARSKLTFIDSLKLANDPGVLSELFPNHFLQIVYLHAPFKVRLARYIARDVSRGFRNQDLTDHDLTLEKHGIWNLIKSADFAIDTNAAKETIVQQIQRMVAG